MFANLKSFIHLLLLLKSFVISRLERNICLLFESVDRARIKSPLKVNANEIEHGQFDSFEKLLLWYLLELARAHELAPRISLGLTVQRKFFHIRFHGIYFLFHFVSSHNSLFDDSELNEMPKKAFDMRGVFIYGSLGSMELKLNVLTSTNLIGLIWKCQKKNCSVDGLRSQFRIRRFGVFFSVFGLLCTQIEPEEKKNS